MSLSYLTLFLFLGNNIQPINAIVKCNTKTSGCGCDLDDGSGSIDFKAMMKEAKTPMFPKIHDSDQTQKNDFTYSFDFCTTFACGSSGNAYACQNTLALSTAIGSQISYDYSEKSKEVTLVMKYQQQQSNIDVVTRITLNCKSGTSGIGHLQPVDSSMSSEYKTTLDSKYSCIQTGSGLTSSNRLSIGSIMCIVLVVCIVVYIIGGIIINKYIRKVDEVFPNKNIWSNLPFYIKDGCVFTCSRIRKQNSEYEEIPNKV